MKIVTPREAWELLKTEDFVHLIDVRTESEWQELSPSLSLLSKDILFLTITNDLDKFCNELENKITKTSDSLLFLCYSGKRSGIAAEVAEKIGYYNSCNIEGGIIEWQKQGLSLKTKEPKNA